MWRRAMTFFYFAYGSNMLTERLKARCPGATAAGRAFADGAVIEFNKRSKDKSGKATLRNKAGGRTAGVLFEIPKAELSSLDRCEGCGRGYDRYDKFPVRLVDDNEIIPAVTYLASCTDSSLNPYDWYLALVIAGAHEHGLGGDYLASLQCVPYRLDPDDRRRTRVEAIKALTAAGFPEYRKLLRQA